MALATTRWDKGVQQMSLGAAKQESGDLVGASQHYEIGIQMMIDHLKTLPSSDRKLMKQAKVESYMDMLANVKEQISTNNPNAAQKLQNRIVKPKPQSKPKQRAKLPKPKQRAKPSNLHKSHSTTNTNYNRRRSSSNTNSYNKNSSNLLSSSSSGRRGRSKSETELYNKILNEIVTDKNSINVTFNDVIGLENVKQALLEAVILPAQRPDIFTGPRSPPKGILLFGPPGNGKTFIAKALASECNATFFCISASSLTSRYVGESEKLVRALFEAARDAAPSIVFIDEIDSILTMRGGDNEQESSRRMKTEFLVQMDGVQSSQQGGSGNNKNKQVLLVGATNLPWQLDDAVLRRFERRILVPLPDANQRKFIIMSKLKANQNHKNKNSQISYKLSDKDINNIVSKTEGYSASDLKNLVGDASMGPVRDLGMKVLNTKKVPPVTYKHFLNALENIRPASNQQSLVKFNQWNNEFGSKLNIKNSKIQQITHPNDIDMNNNNNYNNNSNNSMNNSSNSDDYEMKSSYDDAKQSSQSKNQPNQPAPQPPKSQKSKGRGLFSLFT